MTQAQALEIMLSGANVFLTGAPGAGKTYVLNEFIEAAEAEGQIVAVTASTGIAASHLGGSTIHSWSGLGISEMLSLDDIRRYKNNGRLVKRYSMVVDGDKFKREALVKNILAPQQLELKVGAEVMFVANNFEVGYVNGTRGKVVGFKKKGGLPVVQLQTGRKITVERFTWQTKEDERVLASAEQIPLRLAWAITVHKSQGMSLDAADIDLSKAFTPGMGYVALSRVRSLEGLYLQGFNDMALTMHTQIYDFDKQLRELSETITQEVKT